MTYPQSSGFLAGSETSEEAARHIDATVAIDQLRGVERLIHGSAYHGTTADDVRQDLQIHWPHMHNNIVSARIARLVNMGRVMKTARKRKVTTGRNQTIYVHADYADMEQGVALQSTQKKADFLKEIDPVLRAMAMILNDNRPVRIEPNGPFHQKLKERFA